MRGCARTAVGAQRSWNKQFRRDVAPQKQKKTPGDTGKQNIDDMNRGVPDKDKLILMAVHGMARSTIPKNNVLQRMWCVDAANGKDTSKPTVLLN